MLDTTVIRRAAVRAVAALLLVLAGPAVAARADRVLLHDGRILEGKVTETATEVEVRLRHGVVRVPRSDVARIERMATREEELATRLDALDRADEAALVDLAGWCQSHGFTDEGRELAALARKLERARLDAELAARRKAAAPDDADALRDVARWCRDHGFTGDAVDLETRAAAAALDRRVADAERRGGADGLVALAGTLETEERDREERRRAVRRVLERAVHLEVDHAEARRRLGQVHFRGKWVTRTERGRVLEAEHARTQRSKGLVPWKRSWVTPSEQLRLEEEERKAEHRESVREQERRAADAAARRAEADATAARRVAERETAERDRVCAERDRARAEAERLEQERRLLEAERVRAEADARRIEEDRQRAAEREALERVALLARLRGDLAAVKAAREGYEGEKRAIECAPAPSDATERALREARIKSLKRQIDAAQRTERELADAVRRAEALCR